MTPAERTLWEALRDHRLAGIRFRDQHVIDGLVVDFYAPSLQLVIELDGPIHDTQQDEDATREEALAALGITIVRFTNEAVLNQLPTVLETILAMVPTALARALSTRVEPPRCPRTLPRRRTPR